MAALGSRRSPLILAPAKIPITEGKKTENISAKLLFHCPQRFAANALPWIANEIVHADE